MRNWVSKTIVAGVTALAVGAASLGATEPAAAGGPAFHGGGGGWGGHWGGGGGWGDILVGAAIRLGRPSGLGLARTGRLARPGLGGGGGCWNGGWGCGGWGGGALAAGLIAGGALAVAASGPYGYGYSDPCIQIRPIYGPYGDFLGNSPVNVCQ